MDKILIASALVLAATAAFAGPDKKAPAAPKQTTCAVTGEKLGGDMGKPIDVAYTGKLAAYKGKSVKVCCGGCIGKVKSTPDKYFKAVFAAKPAVKPTAAKMDHKMGAKS
jgi:hypothetical protein